MLRTKKVLYQQALLETIQKHEKLPPESNKAMLITEKIVDFIVKMTIPFLLWKMLV